MGQSKIAQIGMILTTKHEHRQFFFEMNRNTFQKGYFDATLHFMKSESQSDPSWTFGIVKIF